MVRAMQLSVVLVFGLMACSATERSDAVGYVVRDSAGVRIVESFLPEWAGGRQIDPVPMLQIGEVDGEGEFMFAIMGDLAFVGDSIIGATDSQANEVRFFDLNGHHLGTFGRGGSGPEEFRGLGRIEWYPGDSVAAFDFGLSRIVVFRPPSGSSRIVSGQFEGSRIPVLGILRSGSFLSYKTAPRLPPSSQVGGWDTTTIVLTSRAGDRRTEVKRVLGTLRSAGQGTWLTPTSVTAAHEDGFYWARTDRYEIQQFDSLGTLRALFRRSVQPEAMDDAARDEYMRGTLEALRARSRDGAAARYEELFREAAFAETRPLFRSAFVDRDQRLWVSSWPWPAQFEPSSTWSVFSSDGRWLGDIEAPPGVRIHDAWGDLVLGHWRGELDVPYIRVHRILPTAEVR